jgi:hypothetical protein
MVIEATDLPPEDAYLEHLAAHGEAMAQGLRDGTLTAGKVVCGA